MKLIDLTYDIHEGMTTFNAPWHPHVSITQIGRIGHEGRTTHEVSFGTHTGTQVDAPLHFIEGGKTIDQLALKQLVGEVTILDLSRMKINEEVTVEMLKGQDLKPRVLFCFGWGKHWGSKKFYRDYPFLSKAAAKYLVSKKVQLVAIDTPSPDDSRITLRGETLGSSEDSPIHKILLGNGVALVEYVANTDLIKDMEGWNIAALPLKIRGVDGSPARVFLFK